MCCPTSLHFAYSFVKRRTLQQEVRGQHRSGFLTQKPAAETVPQPWAPLAPPLVGVSRSPILPIQTSCGLCSPASQTPALCPPDCLPRAGSFSLWLTLLGAPHHGATVWLNHSGRKMVASCQSVQNEGEGSFQSNLSCRPPTSWPTS